MNTDPTTTTTTSSSATDATSQRSRFRRTTIVGLGSGLAAGGVVGLLMTVPTLTNAATDTDSAPAAVTAEADDDAAADAERAAHGERLREVLQPLVDDGTLTADQADAVTEHLEAHREERVDDRIDRRQRHGRGVAGDAAAEALGIEVEELRDALRGGATIADLAEANGVDLQTVIDAIVAEAETRLDEAVANGRMDEDEAAERLADLEERITDRVNGVRPERG